jgi:uncharacterized protein (TIGR00369 family)
MEKRKKAYSEELSEKIIKLMQSFIGKDMKEFPLPCLSKWMGGTLTRVERGIYETEITITREMTNPTGYLHGGFQSALLDDAMGYACATLGYEKQFLSTNLSIDYLGTARAGEIVQVKAWIYREGKTVLHAVGEITKNEKVIAKAQSNLFISGFPVNLPAF